MDSAAVSVAVGAAAGWALVGWLVRYIVTWQRRAYDERVADLKRHDEEKTSMLRDQIATGAVSARSIDRLAGSAEVTRKIVEALPVAGGERAT